MWVCEENSSLLEACVVAGSQCKQEGTDVREFLPIFSPSLVLSAKPDPRWTLLINPLSDTHTHTHTHTH